MLAGSTSHTQPAAVQRSWGARVCTLFGASIGAHLPFIALIGGFGLIAHFMIGNVDGVIKANFSEILKSFLIGTVPVLLIAALTMQFIHLVIFERPERPTIALCRNLKWFFGDPARLAAALPMVLTLVIFLRSFALIKANIPAIQPYSWDETFIELDRILHFGYQPWQWLQPVLGYAPVTFMINFLYNLWFIVMWIFWIWFAFNTTHWHLRARFFLSFILIWAIGGGAIATGLSSVGPCFLGPMGLDESEFRPLMDYLNHVNTNSFPIWALNVQDMLWQGYVDKTGAGAGISAMPSMHNASTLLFTLVAWQLNRVAGIVTSIFAVVILIGSVHLGWHYAIDGYLGFVITLVIWRASKPIATWFCNLSATKKFLAMQEPNEPATQSTP